MSGAAILPSMMTTERRFGAQSMSSPLLDVLVKRPGPAFGAAFDDPAHGFLHPVDLDLAQREHDAFVETLAALGPRVHVLETELRRPDLVYTFDPLLVTDRGAIPLRPGKPNRAPRAGRHRGVDDGRRHPDPRADRGARHHRGRRHVLAAAGPVLHRADVAHQRRRGRASWPTSSVATSAIFDVPYWRGPAELIHLMSVISPVADDLAVVYLPLLPVGLWQLLGELGIRLVEVPDEEFPTLGCNVLAVRPGVVILAEGNPRTAAALAAAGCEVHTYPGHRDRGQRLGRADLHDPADPAWLTLPGIASARRSIATGWSRTSRRSSGSRASPAPRRRSRPGRPTRSATSG